MESVTTIIDASKFGWQSAIVFFKLTHLNDIKIKNFIEYLEKNCFVVEILELAGGWDFAVRIYYKNVTQLGQTLGQIDKEFVNLIANHQIFFTSKTILRPYNALFPDYSFDFPKKEIKSCKLDKLDFNILSSLSRDCRKPLSVLSEELKENRMTIHNRIKKMFKGGVIDSFRPSLSTEKLGFHWYLISLQLNERTDSKIKEMISGIKGIMSSHFIVHGFGLTDFVFYVQVKTLQDLQKVLYSLRSDFSDDIKSIESANIIRDYKWDFFPEGFLEVVHKE